MATPAKRSTVNTPSLPDRLWKTLRGVADDGLARRAATNGVSLDNRVRGEVYLFIVDVIAHEVDRLDQEHESALCPAPEEEVKIVDLARSDWTSRLVAAGPC